QSRTPFLRDTALRNEMHSYLAGVCRNVQCPSLIVGGVEDHVHILCRLGRGIAVSDLLKELKVESSKWVKSKDPALIDFHWQNGYGAFSVSPSHVEILREYIATQESHHHKESFQEEFRRLLHKYGLEYDERYVWD